MLGSHSEAEDAVQEAWLRVSSADTAEIENLGRWLTTVVARICLDMLRVRKARREDLGDAPEAVHHVEPDHDELLADSVGAALLVVLEKLSPTERVAFVLHDMFDMPFDEIAAIVGSTSVAARQLASRARRRVQGANPETDVDRARQREVVDAFFAASREGNLNALLAVLSPDVVLRADRTAVAASAANPRAPQYSEQLRGAESVARTFLGRAQAARPALIDGFAGAVFAPGGQLRAAIDVTVVDGKIVAIEIIAEPEQLAALQVSM
ncbi:MAG: sigma-70 family RNA polymerase sigma factor [Polyangiales bacterium]